jgi:hypothetical protein
MNQDGSALTGAAAEVGYRRYLVVGARSSEGLFVPLFVT